MVKMYDITLDNGTKVTVISDSISHAIEIAEFYGDIAIDCCFVKNINKLRIDASIVN